MQITENVVVFLQPWFLVKKGPVSKQQAHLQMAKKSCIHLKPVVNLRTCKSYPWVYKGQVSLLLGLSSNYTSPEVPPHKANQVSLITLPNIPGSRNTLQEGTNSSGSNRTKVSRAQCLTSVQRWLEFFESKVVLETTEPHSKAKSSWTQACCAQNLNCRTCSYCKINLVWE